jgi:hypothetical protein
LIFPTHIAFASCVRMSTHNFHAQSGIFAECCLAIPKKTKPKQPGKTNQYALV